MQLSLPAFALKRPITITMLVITLLGLGVIAWQRIPLKFMPEMDFPFIVCYIPYPGATPEQVEKEVAIPAEGEFRTISHLKRISTYASGNGCRVFMQFDWDVEMGLASAEVRDRIERLKLVLPDAIDDLFLWRFNSESMPVMVFGIGCKENPEEFVHVVRSVLQPRLMRLPGVADIEISSSSPEREVMIEFDQNALRSHNVPLYQLISQLQTANLNISVGELLDGETKYYVRVLDEFRRPEELAELVVGPHSLRLKDIAKVGYNARDMDWHYDVDGKGGAFVQIRKESEANTVATCQAIHEELAKLKKDPLFEEADFLIVFDQSEMILTALHNLVAAGKYGGCMALMVLFLFLRRIRPTLLVALAIPSSLVCAVVFMFFAGITLNVVTMVSMIVAIGMLVDNSIVVIENIYRYRQLGFDRFQSARRGASEVSLAITAATLTTMVVFVPVIYMESGEMSSYMRQFAAPMAVALVASLLIALTVIPLATSRMKEREQLKIYGLVSWFLGMCKRITGPRISGFLAHFSRQHVLNGIIHAYASLLGLTMRRPFAAVVIVAALLAITYQFPFRKVGIQQMPELDLREISIEVDFDQNFDIAMAEERFSMITERLEEQREELGIKNIFTYYDSGGGSIELYLLDVDDMPAGEQPPYLTEDVLNILWKRLPARMPGVELKLAVPQAQREGGAQTISLRFRGDDTAMLTSLAEQFKVMMEGLPHISDVELDTQRPEQEMQLHIDDPLAEQAGVSPWIIARTVDVALRGNRLPYMKQGGREVPVWAQFREEDRKTKANLDNVAVMGTKGTLVPLNQLVEFEKAATPSHIRRVDGKNVIGLFAKISTTNYMEVQRWLRSLIDYFEFPMGYSIDLGDEFQTINKNTQNFVTTLILAVILIYLVMSALFESCLLPLSILTTVPLSFVGVYWMMYFTQTALDAVSFIGCILMVGIVVNNGIVIVDHINNLRNNGMDCLEAIVQAGRDRFRPVMMTAITTILGCLPLAIGSEYGSRRAFMSLGRALIGGLTAGTLLTLIVVPLFYSLIDDLRNWFLRYFANLAGIGSASETSS